MLMGILALIIFFGSVLLPITLAVYSWKLAQIPRIGWLFHLLFVPLVIVCEWVTIGLLGFAVGDNGDGPPGEGFLYAPAFLMLIITVFTYYTCLATTALLRKFRGRTNVR